MDSPSSALSLSLPVLLLLLLLLLCCSPALQHASSMADPAQPDTNLALSDVGGRRARTKIYHPSTGLCVLRRSLWDPLRLGPCSESDAWSYTPQKMLLVKGTYFCLRAAAPGELVYLDIICEPSESQWLTLPARCGEQERTYLASKSSDGTTVCLDVDYSAGVVVANPCTGLDSAGDHDSQWFKLVTGINDV